MALAAVSEPGEIGGIGDKDRNVDIAGHARDGVDIAGVDRGGVAAAVLGPDGEVDGLVDTSVPEQPGAPASSARSTPGSGRRGRRPPRTGVLLPVRTPISARIAPAFWPIQRGLTWPGLPGSPILLKITRSSLRELVLLEDVGVVGRHLPEQRVGRRVDDKDDLFVDADEVVVEGGAADDLSSGELEVGVRVHHHRRVAGTCEDRAFAVLRASRRRRGRR